MKSRTRLALIGVALTTIPALAACGATKEITAATDAPTTEAPTTEAPTTAPATTAKPTTTAPKPTTTTAPKPKAEPTITESAFWQDRGTWYYAVVMANDSPTEALLDMSVTVEGYDTQGRIAASSSDYTNILPAGKVAITGSFYDAPEGTVITEVKARAAWNAKASPNAGAFTVTEVAQTMEEYHDQPTVSGQITSSFAVEQTGVKVTVLLRDTTGKIVTAQQEYLERIPTTTPVLFKASFFGSQPLGAVTPEVYVSL